MKIVLFLFLLLLFLFPPKTYADFFIQPISISYDIPDYAYLGIISRSIVRIYSRVGVNEVYIGKNDIHPQMLDIGDEIVITNLVTNKTLVYSSNCSTKKLPPLYVNPVLDQNIFDQSGSQLVSITLMNVCAKAKHIDDLYLNILTDKGASDAYLNFIAAANTTIADYKQTDPQWGTDHLNNANSCGTMYSFGCAVTSVANVFKAYGAMIFNDASSLTPGTLNNWLAKSRGFSDCGIIWASAAQSVHLGPPSILFRNGNPAWIAGAQMIDAALQNGNLPIVGILTKYGTHFIALSQKLPDTNGKPDYTVIDPALYPFVQNDLGKTGMPLSSAYGGFDKIFETVVYARGSTAQNSLTIRAHSPVQLSVLDPNGNQTGYSVTTGQINQNIPQSAYGVESAIAPVDGSALVGEDTKYFQQINPSPGIYELSVVGTGEGKYSLDITNGDSAGNLNTKVLTGYAQKGVNETYEISYVTNALNTPRIEKQVTFDVLRSDIKVLFSQNQIKSKGISEVFLAQTDIAQKAGDLKRQTLGNKIAILALRTFLLLLDKEHNKNVTDDGYNILVSDVNSLITMLTHTVGGGSGGGT